MTMKRIARWISKKSVARNCTMRSATCSAPGYQLPR